MIVQTDRSGKRVFRKQNSNLHPLTLFCSKLHFSKKGFFSLRCCHLDRASDRARLTNRATEQLIRQLKERLLDRLWLSSKSSNPQGEMYVLLFNFHIGKNWIFEYGWKATYAFHRVAPNFETSCKLPVHIKQKKRSHHLKFFLQCAKTKVTHEMRKRVVAEEKEVEIRASLN